MLYIRVSGAISDSLWVAIFRLRRHLAFVIVGSLMCSGRTMQNTNSSLILYCAWRGTRGNWRWALMSDSSEIPLIIPLFLSLSLFPPAISHDNCVLVQPEAHGHTDKMLARGESGAPSVIIMLFALKSRWNQNSHFFFNTYFSLIILIHSEKHHITDNIDAVNTFMLTL